MQLQKPITRKIRLQSHKEKLQRELTRASNLFSAVTNGKLVSSATASAIFLSNLAPESFIYLGFHLLNKAYYHSTKMRK